MKSLEGQWDIMLARKSAALADLSLNDTVSMTSYVGEAALAVVRRDIEHWSVEAEFFRELEGPFSTIEEEAARVELSLMKANISAI